MDGERWMTFPVTANKASSSFLFISHGTGSLLVKECFSTQLLYVNRLSDNFPEHRSPPGAQAGQPGSLSPYIKSGLEDFCVAFLADFSLECFTGFFT
jgi:hypothetical protein